MPSVTTVSLDREVRRGTRVRLGLLAYARSLNTLGVIYAAEASRSCLGPIKVEPA